MNSRKGAIQFVWLAARCLGRFDPPTRIHRLVMDNLLFAIFYAFPYVAAVIAAICIVVLGGLALKAPWIVMLPFLTVLFWLSANRFGQLDVDSGASLINRGAGVLLFPALLWSMLVALAWTRLGAALRKHAAPPPMVPLTPWFAGWALLLLAHVVVGTLFDVPVRQTLSPAGFSLVVWLWVLIAVMVASVTRPTDARRLLWFIIMMGLARALYGLARFAAFGGDPANAYANRQGLTLKLTFFDINDSLLCVLSICLALVMLYRDVPARGWFGWQKMLLWAAVALPALCVVLSFRRTAWVGMVLALGFVLLQLPARVRWRLVLMAMPVMLVGIGYAAWKRLSQIRGGSGGFLYDFEARAVGAESLRVLELKLAWQSFLDSPIFGVGSWGGYKGWQSISWQHEFGEGGGGTFLHSGVLHLALKTGLIGLVLLAGTAIAFILAWRRMRNTLPPAALPLAVAGVAGVLFMMPDWLIGTPIPQVRTMMMLGLCLSLPFVAERCFSKQALLAAAALHPAPSGLPRYRGARPAAASRLAARIAVR